MFELNKKYEVERRILKCNYIRYSPEETSTTNTPLVKHKYLFITQEKLVVSLVNSYPEINFDITKKADISSYAIGNDKRLVN